MTGPDWLANLQPGEALLWQGAPDPNARVMRKKNNVSLGIWWFATFTALLGIFAFAAYAHLTFSALSLSGVLFLGLLFFILGPPVYLILIDHHLETRALRRSRFAVTDRRVMVLEGGRKARVFSQAFANIASLHISQDPLPTLSLWDADNSGRKEAPVANIHFRQLTNADDPARLIRERMEGLK